MSRPNGIVALAIFSFLGAGMALLGAFAVLAVALGVPQLFVAMLYRAGPGVTLDLEIVSLFLGSPLLIANGIGLLRLRNWARILTICLTGLSLLVEIFAVLGAHGPMWMSQMFTNLVKGAIDVWILIYLFKPHVKQAFGATGF